MRVLITGATGNIGQKLRRHLLGAGGYELELVCLNRRNDPLVATADLRSYDPAWTGLFKDVDVVVHLANRPASFTRWEPADSDNMDINLNVYNAAAEHGVKRVVFASSVWTMYGYRFRDGKRGPDIQADPGVSPYGMTKILSERIGKAFHVRFGISTVVLRIGACEEGDNVPGKHMPTGGWMQDSWISNHDVCNGFERAIRAEHIGYAVLNLTSANPRAAWSLEETTQALGYRPRDSHITRIGAIRRLQTLAARIAFHILPALGRRIARPYW